MPHLIPQLKARALSLALIASWFVTAGTAVLAYAFYSDSRQLASLQNVSDNYQRQLLEQVEANTQQRLSYEKELEALEEKLLNARAQIAGLSSALQVAEGNADPNIDAIREQARREAEAMQEESAANPMNPLFERLNSPENTERMARVQVNSMYNDFLNMLNVDENQREYIKDLLIEASAEMMSMSLRAMSDGLSDEETLALAEGNIVRDALASALSNDQLEMFDDYQLDMGRRQLENAYQGQLSMAAPNLTAESRQVVLDTVVDELMAAQNFNGRPTLGGPPLVDDTLDRQLDALDRAQEQLSTALDRDQLRESQNFIEQLRAGIELGREMMGGQGAIRVNVRNR